jgi:type VI secretion system Hcp family effector
VTNEVLKKVTFEFLKTSAKGEEQVYFMVTLTNATVCTLRQMTGGGSGGGEGSAKHTSAKDTMELEEVAFTFDRIDIEDKINGVMAADSWTGN